MYICPHSSTIPLKLDGMESIPFPSIVIVVLFIPFLPLQANAP